MKFFPSTHTCYSGLLCLYKIIQVEKKAFASVMLSCKACTVTRRVRVYHRNISGPNNRTEGEVCSKVLLQPQ